MVNISLNQSTYAQAQSYAQADNMTVEEWVALLIRRFVPAQKKAYKMKQIEELSPELQAIIGFAKPIVADNADMNGDKARKEYLDEKYGI